ncbi:cytochrome P450 4C1-like [Centruroides sculpturatus]|uniref:cytochrome P450 4C1-like n=1 Tax=Centruroides sculpturatus TaxID=218467 RepID=UPI000C6E7649|nr:cytochrome P450 4C1-like [Centruroides sculpturatus]
MVVFNTESFYEWKLVIGFAIFLSILYIWKKKSRNKHGDEIPQLSSWAYVWNLIFCQVKAQNFRKLCGKYMNLLVNKKNAQDMKVKKLPSISVLTILWNMLFYQRDNRLHYKSSWVIDILNGIVGLPTLFPKEKVLYVNVFGYKLICFIHPESAKEVLSSNSFITKDSLYDFFIPLLGKNSLLYSPDDIWRKRRRYYAPYFHLRYIKDYQNVFMNHSNLFVEKLKKLQENEIFDIVKWTKYCSLDIVTDLILGISPNSQSENNEEYIAAITRVTKYFSQWLTNPLYWFPPTCAMTKRGKKLKRNVEIIHQLDEKEFKRMKENFVKRHIGDDEHNAKKPNMKIELLIDVLLDLHVNQNLISEEDAIREMNGLKFAALHTSSHAASWTLYFLGRFHEIQDKVYMELQSIFQDDINRNITINDLTKMTYLECVIKESIRIYPPVPVISRKNPYEIKIDDYVLPPKSTFVICMYAIHHNPSVYENPEVFDPDRFLPENFKQLHPYAFLPFSAGPRNCLGGKVAMVAMKTVLANVLRNFKVYSVDPQDKIINSFELFLCPLSGIRMRIEKR